MHFIKSILVAGVLASGLTEAQNSMAENDSALIDPKTRFSNISIAFGPPSTGITTLQSRFESAPDCGENGYAPYGQRLIGRRALITGGDSGIGRAVALAYVREGANVTINYLPEEEEDAQAVQDVLARDGLDDRLTRIPGDLTNETFVGDLVARAAQAMGGLDILVSNAAYPGFQAGPNMPDITNITTASIDRVFRTNVFAAFFLARAAVPLMPPGSAVVVTCSAVAQNALSNALDYSASKAALVNLVRGLAQQIAPRGVRVNGVAPALTYTPFLVTGGMSNEDTEIVANATALQRIEQPVELVPAYVNLADDRNSYGTGQIWGINGAMNAF